MQVSEYGSLREKIAAETKARKGRYAAFEGAYNKAAEAGKAAGEAATPRAMIVSEPSNPFATGYSVPKAMWHVPEGVWCFAWVKVGPGNSSFAKWLVKQKLARATSEGGVKINACRLSANRWSGRKRAPRPWPRC